MSGNEQVGSAGIVTPTGSIGGAALWHGSAESFVSLAPAGVATSVATATDGLHQYGYYFTSSEAYHAMMWSGTAASAADINPAGAVESQVVAAVPGIQVGWSRSPSDHATIWRGSAASALDINPAGFVGSHALGVCDSAVAGYVTAGGFQLSPGVWLGPNFDFQLLPLPAGYTNGNATSVEFHDGEYFVGGWAEQGLGNPKAFLWVGVPAPSSLALLAAAGVWAGQRRLVPGRRLCPLRCPCPCPSSNPSPVNRPRKL
jgi:hypothetical protein